MNYTILKLVVFSIAFFSNEFCEAREEGDDNSPLILTPYIQNKDNEKAKRLSFVKRYSSDEFKSYSGFLTVSKKRNCNTFFWFFESINKTAPIVVWFEGGPGISIFHAIFRLNGPFNIEQEKCRRRKFRYTQFSMLYIESPVGSGYSHCQDDHGYPTSNNDVDDHFMEAFKQFFKLFVEHRHKCMVFMGYSNSGRTVVTIANRIIASKLKFNLKGIAIGNSNFDFDYFLNYTELPIELGFIDEKESDDLELKGVEMAKLYAQDKQLSAFGVMGQAFLGIGVTSTFFKFTGCRNVFNYCKCGAIYYDFDFFEKFVTNRKFRKDLHVGNLPYNKAFTFSLRIKDILKNTTNELINVLNSGHHVLLYNGLLDLIVTPFYGELYVKNLKWKHSSLFRNCKKQILRSKSGEVMGYKKAVHNLEFIGVRDAGHTALTDQREHMYNILHEFVWRVSEADDW